MTIQRALHCKNVVLRGNSAFRNNNQYNLVRHLTTDHLNDDYQYLHRGQIPMLHFQRSLPRLPIPKLEDTCRRYLAAVRPLIDDDGKYESLVKLVTHFRTTGNGQHLQKLLIEHDRANKHTSYICEPWFDMYLKDRRPLPINYNPVLIMKHDTRSAYNDQLTRTTNLVITTLRFMRSLRDEVLEPEIYHLNPAKSDTARYRNIMSKMPAAIVTFVSYAFKAFPLDMSQVSFSFHSESRWNFRKIIIFFFSIKDYLAQRAFPKRIKIEFIVTLQRRIFV